MDPVLFWTIVTAALTALGSGVAVVEHRRRTRQIGAAAATMVSATAVQPIDPVVELDSEAGWVDAQIQAIDGAKTAVSLCLHTIHSSNDTSKAQRVNAALAAAKARHVVVRVLAASNPERFRGAYELDYELGFDVRFAPEIRHYDLRFVVADSSVVVLGVAEPDLEQGKYRPSVAWALLRSTALCEALESDFQRMFLSPNAVSVARHCADTIQALGSVAPAQLSKNLDLDYDVVQTFAGQRPLSAVVGNAVLVFIGRANAGKSTLLRMLAQEYGARCLDLRDLLLPYVHEFGVEHIGPDVLLQVYAEVVGLCRRRPFDAIEARPEWVEKSLTQLFECIQEGGRRAIVVHCVISERLAVARNAKRVLRPSTESVLLQSQGDMHSSLQESCRTHGVPILTLAADAQPASCFEKLVVELSHARNA